MRDVVTLFVEASLAKGEWLAALNALQISATSTTTTNSIQRKHLSKASTSNYYRIALSLATQKNWIAALATLRCAPHPLRVAAQRCTYDSAYLAERVRVYHHVLRCYHSENTRQLMTSDAASFGFPSPSKSQSGNWEKTVRTVFAIATEAFEVFSSASGRTNIATLNESLSAPTAETLILPSSSLPSSSSLSVTTSAISAAELLEWCQAQLSTAPAASSPLSAEEQATLMAHLRAASQAALLEALNDTVPSPSPVNLHSAETSTSSSISSVHVTTMPADLDAKSKESEQKAPPAKISHAAAAALKELHTMLLDNAKPSWNDWSTALAFLPRIPADRLTPHMFVALIHLLSKRRRRAEADRLIRTYVFPADPQLFENNDPVSFGSSSKEPDAHPKKEKSVISFTAPTQATAAVLAADAVVLKAIAEACRRLRSPRLAATLLSSKHIRQHLTPSAAVPLVMVLRDAEEYRPVLTWWAELRGGEKTTHYPLLQHAKLSSYVASCVLRHARSTRELTATTSDKESARWQVALSVFEEAQRGAADPALVLLFQLRLLRQERQWRAAMQLFSAFCARHPSPAPFLEHHQNNSSRYRSSCNSRDSNMSPTRWPNASSRRRGAAASLDHLSALRSVFAVLTEERAEQWVPAEPLQQLEMQVNSYKRQTK